MPASAARSILLPLLVVALAGPRALHGQDDALPPPEATEVWEPVPPRVVPGAQSPPSDATVLFGGPADLSAWQHADGRAPEWTVEGGALTVTAGSGDLETKEAFGDVQLHIEWRTPADTAGLSGQDQGNSGLFLQRRYEVQILDSYQNHTYPNGQAGAIYKQHIPAVNASTAPGTWQRYDVVFIAPRFEDDGALAAPARMTVFHNGVLLHHDVELEGPTVYRGEPQYEPHPAKAPIMLQDHGHPVQFRNIWVREINRAAPRAENAEVE